MTGRLLIAYSNAANVVATTDEYVNSFRRFSAYRIHYLHVTHGAQIDVDLDDFDAVLQSYCVRLSYPDQISSAYIDKLKAYRGVKAICLQDEYERTGTLRRLLKEIGFHLVFTCVPPEHLEQVYPPREFSEAEFVSVVTGYVPEGLAELRRPRLPLAARLTVLGYRGRDIGSRFGRLAFEKYEIGRRMREICVERGIAHDIEVAEGKRITGEYWYDFVESCRAMLGSESGSNIFDLDGSIAERYRAMSEERGFPVGYEEFRPYTEAQDSAIDMGQISPRIFEAAALRTPLVLFSGRYSGALTPGEHFIELRKDFSNVDDVLAQLQDLPGLERLADRAYRDLVASGRYSYRQFVDLVDDAIDRRRIADGSASSFGRPTLAPRRLENDARSAGEKPTSLPHHAMHFQYQALQRRHEELTGRNDALWANLERPAFLAKLMIMASLPPKLRRSLLQWRESSRRSGRGATPAGP